MKSLIISIFLNTLNSDGLFLGVDVGYPRNYWVVLIGFVMAYDKKVKAQARLLLQKNNIAKISTELSGDKKVVFHSKC